GVAVKAFNMEASALRAVRDAGGLLPAATYSPTIRADSAHWYQVYSGAAPTQESADSLLQALRAAKAIEPTAGEVVRRPVGLALRLGTGKDAFDAHETVKRMLATGVPAYT